jgi:signal transduction histidine kinase
LSFGAKIRVVPMLAVVAMALVLLVLGVMQYRWGVEVSNAEAKRLQETLERSLLNVRQDVNRELRTISLELDVPAPNASTDSNSYSDRVAHWKKTAAHPGLVSHVFLWTGGSDQLTLIGSENNKSQKVEWPAALLDLRADLQEVSPHMSEAAVMFARRGRHHDDHRMFFERMAGPGGPDGRDHHPGGPAAMWAFSGASPALVHPILTGKVSPGRPTQATVSWLIVQLDPEVLEHVVLREAFQRHFAAASERDFDIAVIGGGQKPQIIYSSQSDFPALEKLHPDATLNLFGFPGGMRGASAGFVPGPRLEPQRRGPPPLQDIEMLPTRQETHSWQLVAEHRAGSVEAAVTGFRHRNLALGFGVLAVLAGAMTTLIVSTQRASRLAQLQMDFVAGVSHELRTPLTVISSAAENIADGLVREPQQIEHYGSVIKQQAGQLKHLIEQILLFASKKENQLRYPLRTIDVAEAVDLAVENTAELIKASGFVLEQRVDADLPQVRANVQALSQCLQNLITNAAKYSPDSKWIGIRAFTQQTQRGPEVAISIEDRGIGISSDELKHVFEPFYRGASVQEAQIHGSGLGLPLARSIVASMGGSLSAVSELEKGSCFTVHLPAYLSTLSESEGALKSELIRVSPGLQ